MFQPKYELLDIKQNEPIIITKVSKIDRRIMLLHKKPIISLQKIKFDKEKILEVETVKYLDFNDSIFVENRTKFLN